MDVSLNNVPIFCVDVGARKNFGWACLQERQPSTGATIESLVEKLGVVADARIPIAIGFESPLFIPCPSKPQLLGKGREGEGRRPFSATAGALVAVHGLQQMCWLLGILRGRYPEQSRATLLWNEFIKGGYDLFVWEAFVTEKAKTGSHVGDALAAAKAFQEALPSPMDRSCVKCENPISIAGLALLWSGWTGNLRVLHEPTLVVKPTSAAK
ncbi:MAG TPA: hypothetical protein VGT03_06505 [Candidatus Acidoferrales bacterium]|nr:hypothetical protein [Candidatus Acidoferrales bacterium]